MNVHTAPLIGGVIRDGFEWLMKTFVRWFIKAMFNIMEWFLAEGPTKALLTLEKGQGGTDGAYDLTQISGLRAIYADMVPVFWAGLAIVILVSLLGRMFFPNSNQTNLRDLSERVLASIFVVQTGNILWGDVIFRSYYVLGRAVWSAGSGGAQIKTIDAVDNLVGLILIALLIVYFALPIITAVLLFWMTLAVRLVIIGMVYAFTPLWMLLWVPPGEIGRYTSRVTGVVFSLGGLLLAVGVVLAALFSTTDAVGQFTGNMFSVDGSGAFAASANGTAGTPSGDVPKETPGHEFKFGSEPDKRASEVDGQAAGNALENILTAVVGQLMPTLVQAAGDMAGVALVVGFGSKAISSVPTGGGGGGGAGSGGSSRRNISGKLAKAGKALGGAGREGLGRKIKGLGQRLQGLGGSSGTTGTAGGGAGGTTTTTSGGGSSTTTGGGSSTTTGGGSSSGGAGTTGTTASGTTVTNPDDDTDATFETGNPVDTDVQGEEVDDETEPMAPFDGEGEESVDEDGEEDDNWASMQDEDGDSESESQPSESSAEQETAGADRDTHLDSPFRWRDAGDDAESDSEQGWPDGVHWDVDEDGEEEMRTMDGRGLDEVAEEAVGGDNTGSNSNIRWVSPDSISAEEDSAESGSESLLDDVFWESDEDGEPELQTMDGGKLGEAAQDAMEGGTSEDQLDESIGDGFEWLDETGDVDGADGQEEFKRPSDTGGIDADAEERPGTLMRIGESLEKTGEAIEQNSVTGAVGNLKSKLGTLNEKAKGEYEEPYEPMEDIEDEDLETMDEVDADSVDELMKDGLTEDHIETLTENTDADPDSVEDFDWEDATYNDQFETDDAHKLDDEFDEEIENIEDLKEAVKHDDWEAARRIQARRHELQDDRGYETFDGKDIEDLDYDELKEARVEAMRENLKEDGLTDAHVREMEGTDHKTVATLEEKELDHLEKQRRLGPNNPDKGRLQKAYSYVAGTADAATNAGYIYAQGARKGGTEGLEHIAEEAEKSDRLSVGQSRYSLEGVGASRSGAAGGEQAVVAEGEVASSEEAARRADDVSLDEVDDIDAGEGELVNINTESGQKSEPGGGVGSSSGDSKTVLRWEQEDRVGGADHINDDGTWQATYEAETPDGETKEVTRTMQKGYIVEEEKFGGRTERKEAVRFYDDDESEKLEDTEIEKIEGASKREITGEPGWGNIHEKQAKGRQSDKEFSYTQIRLGDVTTVRTADGDTY